MNPNTTAPPQPSTKAGEKPGPADAPGADVSQLFQPGQQESLGQSPPTGAGTKSKNEPLEGNLPRTDPGRMPQRIEDITDPSERAAVQRLQRAIQRIQTNRDRHATKPSAGRGDPANQNGRRDW